MNEKDHFDSVFGVGQNKLRTEMRDDIAVRVLIAMIETTTPVSAHKDSEAATVPMMARTAYSFADAMLAAREGKKATPEEVVKVLQTPQTIDCPCSIPDLEPGCKVLGLDHGKIGAVTGKPSDIHGQIPVKWADSAYSTYGKPENLEVVQRPLKDGDRVTMKGEPGTIQSVIKVRGMAVVQWDKRVPTWELISSLELICEKQP
jgi:hypothetical protein